MKVDAERCIGCLECVDYCPVGAIKQADIGGVVYVDQDECVECGCCLQVRACEYEALWQPELEWPRVLRAQFSNPRIAHPSTSIYGRGTDETKTNEVTGRYPRGCVGIAVELGRPGIGTRFSDVEKVARAILPLGVEFEKDNPTHNLFEDVITGRLRPDVLKERVLSAILEFKTSQEGAPQVLQVLDRVSREVDTVITVNIGSMWEPDGTLPAEEAAERAGFHLYPNGKNNLGLGRPQVKSEEGSRDSY